MIKKLIFYVSTLFVLLLCSCQSKDIKASDLGNKFDIQALSPISGAIACTGWALDDLEVVSVKIYRDPIFGVDSPKKVYIADAVFIEGARPDIEEAFPDLPWNYRAGWGYMLLTNSFPNYGTGSYTLLAIAIDKEGNSTTLGERTIVCDNARAVKPFGTIDTPTQGGTASGEAYDVFGWVLTPQPNIVPIDGSTITVWVDGEPIGSPSYNHYRQDVAYKFSWYRNSGGAVGHFILDTTKYANGIHTIAWRVKDSAGNVDGIGSRFFTILN